LESGSGVTGGMAHRDPQSKKQETKTRNKNKKQKQETKTRNKNKKQKTS
jgi:hypothetical protein